MIGRFRKPKPKPTCTPADISARPSLVKLDGRMKEAVETGRGRLVFGGMLFAGVFVVLVGRLAWLTVPASLVSEPSMARGDGGSARGFAPAMERRTITDRNGTMIATNLRMASLYADTRQIGNPDETANRLLTVLPDLPREELVGRLGSGKSFVWLKRNLTPRQQYEINRLGLPGLMFQDEERRLYPLGPLAVHVVGYTDIDRRGISGIEQTLDEELRDTAKAGEPLELALDLRVQHALRDEIGRSVEYFDAIGGGGLVLDINTGEVLGLVSLPDFDPIRPGSASDEARFNRITLGVYEMGSTMKTINTAMVLENGNAKINSSYDASRPIVVGRFTIKDDHAKNRWLTVPEIYKYSSNIGSAKMAVEAGPAVQRAFLDRLGLLKKAQIELPEVGAPLVPRNWKTVETMTISFGHGLSISPLQLGVATAAIANGGILRPATLLKRPEGVAVPGTRVVRPDVSDLMRKLMYLVVDEGTGKQAAVDGYLVGGKTGTSEKVGAHGGYMRKKLMTSFVGVFPLNKPRYLVIGVLDEPKGRKETYGFATAGWNSAPTVGRVISRIAPILGVEPVDDSSPQVQQVMSLGVHAPQSEKKIASN